MKKPRPKGRGDLTTEQVERVLQLRAEGKTVNKIHILTGHHRKTIRKYCQTAVEGYPQTPIDERVQRLRERMTQTLEYDVMQAFRGDLVLLDEYRDHLAKCVATGRVPALADGTEIKRVIDARATIVRLPSEIGQKQSDIRDQIRQRVKRAQELDAGPTDFRVIGEKATDCVVLEADTDAGQAAGGET